jgi:hypothetical protein
MSPLSTTGTPENPRKRPSIARAVGFVALGWAVVTLVLQVIVAARSSLLPATVHVYMPAYGAGQSTVSDWTPTGLIGVGWAVACALLVVAVLGILFASAARVWIAIALVIVAALGAWFTIAYAGSALMQVGASDVSNDQLRSVIDPVAIVAIVAVLVTAFFGTRLIAYGTLGKSRA